MIAFDHLQQFGGSHPAIVAVAGIYEAIGDGCSMRVIVVSPPCPVGKDDVLIIQFHSVAAVLFGDQDFVEFFAGTDANGVDFAVGGD